MTGSAGQKRVPSDWLRSLLVHLPSLKEQKKIAEILGACDEAIEAQQKLIELKEKRLKGWMQKLLTGKVRFPQFVNSPNIISSRYFHYPSDWNLIEIQKISSQVITRNSHSEIPVLSCTKYDGLVDSLKYFKKQIYADDISNYKVVKRNEFAYATNHLEEGSIGYQNLYDEAVVSPIYCVFKTCNEVNDKWLFLLLKTELFRRIFEANTNASVNRRGSLKWNQFKRLKIALPPKDEQDCIAGMLQTMKYEVNLEKEKLSQLKLQKKSLMQKLLTGKVRVKVDGVVEDSR